MSELTLDELIDAIKDAHKWIGVDDGLRLSMLADAVRFSDKKGIKEFIKDIEV